MQTNMPPAGPPQPPGPTPPWPHQVPQTTAYPGPPAAAYPLAPRRDSTRTIAIVALVLSILALGGGLLSGLLPALVLGALAGGDIFPTDPSAVGGFSGTVYEGRVSVTPGELVPAAELTSAVQDATAPELLGSLRCEEPSSATQGGTALCTGTGSPDGQYVVVRFTDGQGGFEAMTFLYGTP